MERLFFLLFFIVQLVFCVMFWVFADRAGQRQRVGIGGGSSTTILPLLQAALDSTVSSPDAIEFPFLARWSKRTEL